MSDAIESICKNTSTRFGKQRYAIAKFSLQMYIQYHIRHLLAVVYLPNRFDMFSRRANHVRAVAPADR